MGKRLTPKEFEVVWRTKVTALSGADAARQAMHLKPQGTVIATVNDGERKVDVLIKA